MTTTTTTTSQTQEGDFQAEWGSVEISHPRRPRVTATVLEDAIVTVSSRHVTLNQGGNYYIKSGKKSKVRATEIVLQGDFSQPSRIVLVVTRQDGSVVTLTKFAQPQRWRVFWKEFQRFAKRAGIALQAPERTTINTYKEPEPQPNNFFVQTGHTRFSPARQKVGRRGRGTFGRNRPKFSPRKASQLWDEDYTTVEGSLTTTTTPLRNRPSHAATKDESDDEELLFDKHPKAKRLLPNLQDSDDEDDKVIFTDSDNKSPARTTQTMSPYSTSTPETSRPHVSPASRTLQKLDKAETPPRKGPAKMDIAAFFKPAAAKKPTSFDPSKRAAQENVLLSPPRAGTLPALDALLRSEKSHKSPKKTSTIKSKGWVKSTNAGHLSPLKQRMNILGIQSKNLMATPTQDDDPIEEFSSPSSPQRVRIQPLQILDKAIDHPLSRHLDVRERASATVRSRKRKNLLRHTPMQGPSPLRLKYDDATIPELAPTKLVTFQPWRGLENLGNTCYLNASIQMLVTLVSTARGETNWWEKLRGKGGALTKACLDVLDQLVVPPSATVTSVVNPQAIKQAIDATTDSFAGFSQHDAHEFLGYLIDTIHEELAAASKKSISASPAADQEQEDSAMKDSPVDAINASVPDDFQFTLESSLTCSSCGYNRKKEEIYRHLSLDIVQGDENCRMASIPTSLSHFFEPTLLELRCDKCQDGTHAQQTQRISKSPKYLLLHLKRFIFSEREVPSGAENTAPNESSARPAVEYVFQKNEAEVAIDEKVSLGAFCSETASTVGRNFRLRGLVHHHGRLPTSGHYTADSIRPYRPRSSDGTQPPSSDATTTLEPNPEGTTGEVSTGNEPSTPPEEEWIMFDDGKSCRKTLRDIQESRMKRKTAYLLLYSLEP